jgi:HEAT repeat protein
LDEKIQLLLKGLDSDNYDEREAAQTGLLEAGPAAWAALQAAAKNGSLDFQERAEHIRKLADLREKLSPKLRKAYPTIETELLRDSQAWEKHFLLAGENRDFPITDLEALGAGTLRKLQTFGLTNPDQVFRLIAERKLKKLVPELLALLKSENANLRIFASKAMGRLGAKEAIPELLALLKDENASVRAPASAALGELGAKEAIPELLALLKDENENVRACASRALGKLGAKEAIPKITALLTNPDVRRAAQAALEKLREK